MVLEKARGKKEPQSRNWQITDFEMLDYKKIYKNYKDIVRFVGWGREICPKTNREHYQAWIQLVNKKTMGGVKRLLGSKAVHVERMYASVEALDKYCQKDGNYQSIGKYITMGARSDMEYMKKLIEDGCSEEDMWNTNFQLTTQYGNRFMKYKQIIDKKKTREFRKVEVILHKGATGTGKTRNAVESCTEHPYIIRGKKVGKEWWDGYDGEKEIVIDEYNNNISCDALLSLLDGYQLMIPFKGGYTYARWTKVYITTNLEELHMNALEEHQAALARRITKTVVFRKPL